MTALATLAVGLFGTYLVASVLLDVFVYGKYDKR